MDGFYTVEMSDYNNGWKEFVTIRVSGNKIVTVEYNAKNSSGFIKSWDIPYMRNMLDKKKGHTPTAIHVPMQRISWRLKVTWE